MTRYLYILEDSVLIQSSEPPTDGDVACVKGGILSVVRLNDALGFEELQPSGEWEPVPQAKTLKSSDEDGQTYHVE